VRGALPLLALLLVALAPLASAHATLVSSEPAAGSRLDAAPSHVRVVLSEPVDASATGLKVVDQAGKQVDVGDSSVSGASQPVLTASLPADLPDGAYRILWHAVAKDTHPTSGTVGFSVGAFEPPGSSKSAVLHWPSALGRALVFLGLALGLGAAAFLLWMPGSGAPVQRTPAVQALAVGASALFAGAAWLLQDYQLSLGQTFATLLHGRAGVLLAARVVLALAAAVLAALALLPRARNRTAVPVAALCILLAGLASPLLGHAVLHGAAGAAIDAMHLLASCLWAGGLLVFLWTLAAAPRPGLPAAEVRAIGVRFGTLALGCVILLVLTGMVSTLILAGLATAWHPWTLLGQPWGQFLAAKVGLAVLMVGVAAVNRYGFLEVPRTTGLAGRIQAAVSRLGPAFRPLSLQQSAGGFRRTLAVEACMGAAVLILAGFLASVSPPAAAGSAAPTMELRADGDAFRYLLVLDPVPHAGSSSHATLYIQELGSGKPVTNNTCGRVDSSCVQLEFSDPAHPEQGAESHQLQPDGNGGWFDHVLWARSGAYLAVPLVQTGDVTQPDNVTMPFTLA
jgi:copper transport protein